MKLALVHEYLNQYGGAERVLQLLCARWPDAPVYTMLYDRRATGGVFDGRDVRTSFLQRLPGSIRWHHAYTALMPLAVEQFDTGAFDTVLSVSASFAKGIVTKPLSRHVSYCLTPPRFLWDDSQRFVRRFALPSFLRTASPLLLSYLRVWDRQAADRVDEFVAISRCVADRIAKYYGRQASVVYPPVDVNRFVPREIPGVEPYFLMVGRLVAYKRFDIAIRAANRMRFNLLIVGAGVQERKLRKLAGPTVTFLGQVDDEALAALYAGCRAVIFPQEEDFGIVPLEAMAAGRPVIAFGGGGALETVVDGTTGLFFPEQSEDSLMQAVESFRGRSWSVSACRARAESFGTERFVREMENALNPS
ncbi:MAG TPA: glycosyltransferase [Candidatus Paceibacterota bacterium]|nr:glycosyltransferase [Candidatus Paceibacterota bacterium]